MADVPEIGKTPQSGPGSPLMNEPASGTYGEGAAKQQLEAQLPTMPPPSKGDSGPQSPAVNPNPMSAPPGAGPGRPPGSPLPPGIPAGILQGGPSPGAPPMGQPANPMQGAATAAQGRLIVLQQLASSPDVSATTREWAQTMMKTLVG